MISYSSASAMFTATAIAAFVGAAGGVLVGLRVGLRFLRPKTYQAPARWFPAAGERVSGGHYPIGGGG